MGELKKNAIFYGVLALVFYGVPWMIRDTGSGMIIMLIVLPLLCFATSCGYGMKNGFRFRYALIVAAMFIPSIFIFYNSSAWIYAAAYGVIALLGNLAALPFHKGAFEAGKRGKGIKS